MISFTKMILLGNSYLLLFCFLTGHLKLAESLATCDGMDKVEVGKMLITEILNSYLFPSSRLIADGALNNHGGASSKFAANPKCDTPESRVAAYNLLVELAKDCPENTEILTNELIQMHHTGNPGSGSKAALAQVNAMWWIHFFLLPLLIDVLSVLAGAAQKLWPTAT